MQTLNFQTSKLCTSFHYTEPTTETTTTEPPAVVAVKKENPTAKQLESNKKQELSSLTMMIPEKYRTPIVLGFLEQKLEAGVAFEELKACLLYVISKAKGNASQFKSYLGKCLDQKWACGYLEEIESERLRKQEQEAQDAMRAFLEAQKRKAEAEAMDSVLETVDLNDLDNFIESTFLSSLTDWERSRFKRGERYLTRRRFVKFYLQDKLLS